MSLYQLQGGSNADVVKLYFGNTLPAEGFILTLQVSVSHDVGDAHTEDDGDLHVCSLVSEKKYLNFCTTVIVKAKVKINDCSRAKSLMKSKLELF